MKFNIIISSLILALLSGSSCSTINEITGRTPATQNKTVNKEQKTKSGQGKQRGKRKSSHQPTTSPQESVNSGSTHRFTPADSLEILKSLAGEWIFDNVAGIKVDGEDNRPSITFDESSTRFYATNGCNYYNGTFIIKGHNQMSFNGIISTANYCADLPWGEYITALWGITDKFYITRRGAEEYLDLRDNSDRSLATLKRHQLSSINGLWDVVEINGRKIQEENPSLVIDLIEKTVHGNTGCNIFNGTIYQHPDADSSIQFQNMAVTRMSCPGVATETAFLVALEQVERAIIENEDSIILTDSNDRRLLLLKRTTL